MLSSSMSSRTRAEKYKNSLSRVCAFTFMRHDVRAQFEEATLRAGRKVCARMMMQVTPCGLHAANLHFLLHSLRFVFTFSFIMSAWVLNNCGPVVSLQHVISFRSRREEVCGRVHSETAHDGMNKMLDINNNLLN
jgi:hypothetical protein